MPRKKVQKYEKSMLLLKKQNANITENMDIYIFCNL